MLRPDLLLHPTPKGLYCPPGDFYLDPVRGAVDRAVISHGHADHARAGHGHVLAHPHTLAIMAARYGDAFARQTQAINYGERVCINGVDVTLVPAGHILGSAQVIVEYKGLKMVFTGDYKRRADPTCPAFEPVPDTHVLISEATFGLPVFIHPPTEDETAKLIRSVADNPDRTHCVSAYSLGKAQRVIALLRQAGYDAPIHVHGRVEKINAAYAAAGVDLGDLKPAAATPASRTERDATRGQIVVAPPGAFDGPFAQRFADPLNVSASGWMRVRQRAKQAGVELPLVISDHAGWDELTGTILETDPHEVWVTYGREDALVRWAELAGRRARPLRLAGYDEETS